MPNNVKNKIEFSKWQALRIFVSVCPFGKFDFTKLIPQPKEIYNGDISAVDEKDFTCNWLDWNREHWGTKWGAYSQSIGIKNGVAFIQFETTWNVPYPIMSAFANKFRVPFTHKYVCEFGEYWGIETWGHGDKTYNSNQFMRLSKDYGNDKDYKPLLMELCNYDPDAPEEVVL